MADIPHRQWRLFHRTLGLFIALGVTPILIVVSALALPTQLGILHFKMLAGLLLVISTVSTLCLAGIVVRLLKHPIKTLIGAQNAVKMGDLNYRIPPDGSLEMQDLFQGFNDMAAGLAVAAEKEKQMAEDRSLAKVASQVVHDLRSPLATLKVAADYFASKNGNDSDYQDYTKLLQMGIVRLRNIAEELLNRRKNESGRSPTLLHDAVGELLTELSPRYSKKLEFKSDFHHPAIPLAATKIELQRVFGNIITNAIEAMRGIGRIDIKTTTCDLGVRIHIQDNGGGMTDDILKKVLKGGFTYGKMNGNGVGMTVVREIVEKHNGTLNAVSTVGIGTTFIIDLPLYSPAQ